MDAFKVLFIALFVAACSSTPKKPVSTPSEDFLDDIINEDFHVMPEKRYQYKRDYYPGKSGIAREKKVGDVVRPTPLNLIDRCDIGPSKKMAKTYFQYKNFPPYWNALGICLMKKKKYELASLYFGQALGVRRNYVPALNNLAIIQITKKNYAQALTYLKKAIKISPVGFIPRYNLSQIYLKFGLFKAARKLFYELYRKGNPSQNLVNQYAIALIKSGSPRQAITVVNNIDDINLRRFLGSLSHFLAGDKNKARSIVNEINMDSLNEELSKNVNLLKQALSV